MTSITSTGARPRNVIDVGFNIVNDREDLVIATHTDTIQAMLMVANRFPELEVMTKGRIGGDEERTVTNDPLFQQFTQARVERVHFLGSSTFFSPEFASDSRRLTVEESSGDEPFQCAFFPMNDLVRKLMAGQLTANHLLINFGGATDLEVGSNVATIPQLEEYAGALRWEVQARQLGELPDSILRSRLSDAK